jgi:hypothetical protein
MGLEPEIGPIFDPNLTDTYTAEETRCLIIVYISAPRSAAPTIP